MAELTETESGVASQKAADLVFMLNCYDRRSVLPERARPCAWDGTPAENREEGVP